MKARFEQDAERAQGIINRLEECESAISQLCNVDDTGVQMLRNVFSDYFKPMRATRISTDLLKQLSNVGAKAMTIPAIHELISQTKKNFAKVKDLVEQSAHANAQIVSRFRDLIVNRELSDDSYIGEYYGALICMQNVIRAYCDDVTIQNLQGFLHRYLQPLSDASLICTYNNFDPPQNHDASRHLEYMGQYIAEMRLNLAALEYDAREVLDSNSALSQSLLGGFEYVVFDNEY